MAHRREFFTNLQELNDNSVVVLGNGQELNVRGKGSIRIKKLVYGKWYDSTITEVLYVPNLNKNLFSEGVVTKKRMKIVKVDSVANIYENQKLTATAVRNESNLYQMQIKTVLSHEANVVIKDSLQTWHERLGHVNIKYIKEMVSKKLIKGVGLSDSEHFFFVRLACTGSSTN